jgi:hypothetical protein
MSSFIKKVFSFLTFIFLNPIYLENQRKKNFLLNIFALQFLYSVFSILCVIHTFTFYDSVPFSIIFNLQLVQTVVPSLISVYLTIDFLLKREIMEIKKLASYFDESNWFMIKAILCLFTLFLVRVGKILTTMQNKVFVIYTLSTMFPELISSMSDFAFAFYADNLTKKIKNYNKHLRNINLDWETVKKIEETLAEFDGISLEISNVFSLRLFITLLHNFVLLVISLYWIFIRIVYNHFDRIEGFACFLYIIQPLMCYFLIFHSAQNKLTAVSTFFKFISTIFSKSFIHSTKKRLQFCLKDRKATQWFRSNS